MSEDKPIDAEVVPTQALTVRPPTGLPTVADLEQQFALAVRQRELLSDYIQKQLVPNKHFYEVKGSNKKSLTKEGAEIILLPHGFVPDYEMLTGPEAPPEGSQPYQITVKCTLRRKGDADSFVGSGIGSAGSHHGFWNKESSKWEYKPRQPDRYLCHNATLKMAQKSAMIAATINSTAASEFFTQDMDPQEAPQAKRGSQDATPAVKVAPAPARTQRAHIPPTPEMCRAKFAKNIDEGNVREKASQFLIDLGWMMPTESIENMELRYVPRTQEEYVAFLAKVSVFAASGKAAKPYEPHGDEPPKAGAPTGGTAGTKAQPSPSTGGAVPNDEEWWRDIVVPIPRKGMKKAEYIKHPDTIGSLYEARHGNDDESNEMRQRLWGFVTHFEPKPWTKRDGTVVPASDSDHKFRKALDAFADWFEKHHPDEKL